MGDFNNYGGMQKSMAADSLESSFGNRYNPTGIIIHETYEKYGLTSQLITAEDGVSFNNFLASKGLEMPESSRKILNHYIGDEFSFVVTEITNKAEFSGSAAVYTTFPTKSLYYPLVLTSVYESHRIPTKIYVDGYVNPKIYSKIKQYTDVDYYVEGNVKPKLKSDDEDLFKNADFKKYTLVTMNPPSKYLQEDLIMSTIPPISVIGYNFVYEHDFLFALVLFLLFSCLASLIVAVIFKKDKKMYLKAGLFNIFTIIGYFAALNKLNKGDKGSKEIKVINKTIFVINCIVSIILLAFLLYVVSMTLQHGSPSFYDPIEFLFFNSLFIIPLMCMYLIWKPLRITTKILMEVAPDKLKTIKIGFFREIILFSIVFIIICILFFAML